MPRSKFSSADVCSKLLGLLNQLHPRRAARLDPPRRAVCHPSEALRALCAGAITVEEYLFIKLDVALQPLTPLLRHDDLTTVRTAMSERICTEPMWRSVVEELRSAVARERVLNSTVDDR